MADPVGYAIDPERGWSAKPRVCRRYAIDPPRALGAVGTALKGLQRCGGQCGRQRRRGPFEMTGVVFLILFLGHKGGGVESALAPLLAAGQRGYAQRDLAKGGAR